MNNIKTITVGLTFLFSSLTSLSAPNHRIADFHANLPAHELVSKFNDGLSVLLNEYRTFVKSPLDARLMNIAEPQTYRFLKNSTQQEYTEHFLAVQYFPNYVVNQMPTSFCFVLYDDKKRYEVSHYYQLFPNKDFALSYLISHEFAHCMYRHQSQVRTLAASLTPHQNESFADIFSYSYFLSKGYPDISNAIEKFSKMDKKNEIHNNYPQLKSFISYLKNNKISLHNKNIMEIYEISMNFVSGNNVNYGYYTQTNHIDIPTLSN